MDIICPKCAEPWDNDSIHEEVDNRRDDGDTTADYYKIAAEFRRKGCQTFTYAWDGDCGNQLTDRQAFRAQLAGVAYDMLGDDMDGAASLLDDYFWAHKL